MTQYILQRKWKRPRFYEDGPTEHFFFDIPELIYKQIYFEYFDAVVSALKDCFQQCEYSLYANMEQLLIKVCLKTDYSHDLHDFTEFFKNDLNILRVRNPSSAVEMHGHRVLRRIAKVL